jgi:hypothetical protein
MPESILDIAKRVDQFFMGTSPIHQAMQRLTTTLIVGEYPGDGLPKPVAFPPPEDVVEIAGDGIPYISLKTLLELKMASGMTAPHRPRDLDDVIQLIRANRLPLDYGESLNPYVADKFRELWQAAQIVEDY